MTDSGRCFFFFTLSLARSTFSKAYYSFSLIDAESAMGNHPAVSLPLTWLLPALNAPSPVGGLVVGRVRRLRRIVIHKYTEDEVKKCNYMI